MLFQSVCFMIALACSGSSHPDPHLLPDIEFNVPCDSIPSLNKKIVAYVNANLNKKVGRGECWDLAAIPLNANKAKWNGKNTYGRLMDFKSECTYPGDIIQFENVKIETVSANGWFVEHMPHHTAIVYTVHAPGHYTIAHQNYGGTKKVILTTLKMESIKQGKAMMYRPQG